MKTKNEAKHTPGPWKIELFGADDYEGKNTGIKSGSRWIAEVFNPPDANSRLIAAAPELLEVAKDALEIVLYTQEFLKYQKPGREFYPNREGAEACEARLKQAIAKAEGK